MVNDVFIDESVLTTGRYISVVATALKNQNTFVWDEDQASDNDKEYSLFLPLYSYLLCVVSSVNASM